MSNGEKWVMPQWMIPYTDVIAPREKVAYIEEMVNDSSLVQVNAPRALIACTIKGKIQMITSLYDKGLLNAYDPDRIC